MKKEQSYTLLQRVLAFALVFVMVAGYVPVTTFADTILPVTTVADPETLDRVVDIYGNDTLHAGKVSVGKSVTDQDERLNNPDNFMVTVSQTAQVAGLSSQSAVPMDVVFVLDTSGSMKTDDRSGDVVDAANAAIKALMEANTNNRIGVVAFSGSYSANSSSNAATQLSALAHYTGDAANNHLTVKNNYVSGRGTNAGSRHVKNGGTSIHSGVYLGAQMLASADTTVVVNGETVTRMPFLVILSDGAPTYSCASEAWYAPSISNSNQQGPGSGSYAGNGFLPALTAAYYKGVITDHYYGEKASETNRCFIYTIGVGFNTMSGNDKALAQMTLDPATYLTDRTNSYYNAFSSYWNSYTAGNAFDVVVKGDEDDRMNKKNFTVTANTISHTRNFVNGDRTVNGQAVSMYDGGLAYNDDHFIAENTQQITAAFKEIVKTVSEKALSSPTHVDINSTPEFSGYVTFTDPIGEFMEVKQIEGISHDGTLYTGEKAAEYLNGNASSATFRSDLEEILIERLGLTGASASLARDLIDGRMRVNDGDNAITWWGRKIADSNESHVQVLKYADGGEGDMLSYIKQNPAPTVTLDGTQITADMLCRSYFFYETGTDEHDYMHLMVRVQQELTAPYRQTVVVSIPSKLLSVDKVMITEEDDGATAEIIHDDAPLRVLYEVGIRSDITPQNVQDVVEAEMPEYADEGSNMAGDGTYLFYTNDWDRDPPDEETYHHKAMAKATFEAAQDNPFYAYQEDTPILKLNNDGTYTQYTGTDAPVGEFYYARKYYVWDASKEVEDNTYQVIPEQNSSENYRTEYIKISLSENDQKDGSVDSDSNGNWYITKGTYTSHSLVVEGEEVNKQENTTGTAFIISHPHKTETGSDAHYTVLLGNNGRLSMSYDPPVKNVYKTVNYALNEADGKFVTAGEKLTYKVTVKNHRTEAADIVITDYIPEGTSYVAGTAKVENRSDVGELKTDSTNNRKYLEWTVPDVPADTTVTVVFEVQVEESAIQSVTSVNNQATITFEDEPAYKTNTTKNPVEGKISTVDGNTSTEAENTGLKVGDRLIYTIRYFNDSEQEATVTIEDSVPAGTTYHEGSASNGGVHVDGKLTWEISNVPAGMGGVVSFAVFVNASAKDDDNDGKTDIRNQSTITINNNPRVTNTTENEGGVGNLSVKKIVTKAPNATDDVFTMILSESAGKLSGTYAVTTYAADGSSKTTSVVFTNGVGRVSLKADETAVVQGLPLGATISVLEDTSSAGMEIWKDTYEEKQLTTENTEETEATADEDGITLVITGDTGSTAAVDVTVTNEYITVPVSFQLTGKKNFEGTFPAGEYVFGFTAHECNSDGNTEGYSHEFYGTVKKVGTETTIEFTPLDFTQPVTKYYLITEDDHENVNIYKDHTQYLMTLKVDYKTGTNQLEAKATFKRRADSNSSWTDTTDFAFTNTYPVAAVTIHGEKTLEGRYITNGEFSFELLDSMEPEHVISNTGVVASGNSNTGTFTFTRTYTMQDLIVKNAEGEEERLDERTFTYYIKEVNSGAADVIYDPGYKEVQVKLSRKNGVLQAAVVSPVLTAPTAAAVSFTNTLKEASIHLYTSKTMTGDHTLTAGEFTFSVYETDADGKILQEQDANGESQDRLPVASGSNKAVRDTTSGNLTDTSVDLGLLEYTPADLWDGSKYLASKDFYYVVKENIPAEGAPTFDPGMDYDESAKRFKVTVTMNANGMTATAFSIPSSDNDPDGSTGNYTVLAFENDRAPRQISVTPNVKKNTKTKEADDTLPGDLRFSFAVRPADVAADGVTVTMYPTVAATGISAPAVNNTNVNVEFTNLVFTDAHLDGKNPTVYYYVIEESNAGVTNGVTYDQSRYLMEVTLSRNDDLELTADIDYYELSESDNANGNTENITLIKGSHFVNDNPPIFKNTYDADVLVNLTATKELSGRALKADEFDFRLERLKKVDENSYKPVGTGAIDGINVATEDEKNNLVTFASINFDLDKLPRPSDEAETDEEKAALAENLEIFEYHAAETSNTATQNLESDDEDDDAVDPGQGDGGDDSVDPNQGDGGDDSVDPNQGDGGDDSVDPNQGDGGDDPIDPDQGGGGEDPADPAAPAAQSDDDDTSSSSSGASNTTQSREYWRVRYLMSEIEPEDVPLPGMTYDTDKYIVTIDLYYEDNQPKAEAISYTKAVGPDNGKFSEGEPVDSEDVAFENTYSIEGTSVTIQATKTMTGRTLKDGEFAFNLYRVDGDTEHFAAGATNDADGNISFTRVYNPSVLNIEPGEEYSVVYHMTETNPTVSGVSKVSGDYYVKVVIKHDANSASYKVEAPEYYTDKACTKEATDVVFENKYDPVDTAVTLQAKKQLLDKDNKKLEISENQFSFVVTDSAGKVVATGNSGECDNGEDSNVAFTPITISAAGDYVYTITEVAGSDSLITYDGTSYYAKVKVQDNQTEGKLTHTIDGYYEDEACTKKLNGVVFENHQSNGSVDVSLALELEKVLSIFSGDNKFISNKTLTGGEYDFEVKQGDTQVSRGSNVKSETKENAEPQDENIAKIVFENFSITLDQFNTADTDDDGKHTFEYAVTEIGGNQTSQDAGVQLDSGTITVKVPVEKDKYNNLTIDPTKVVYEKSNDQNNSKRFVNKFTFESVTLDITGTKKLNGKDLAAGEFNFKLTSDDDTAVALDGTNDATGKIIFGTRNDDGTITATPLTFQRPGTYTYTVRELEIAEGDQPEQGKYYTDGDTFKVIVTVTADVNGDLYAVPMYKMIKAGQTEETESGGIAFSNLYTPKPVELDLKDSIEIRKTIANESGTVLEPDADVLSGFQFELVGISDNVIIAQSNEYGIVEFAPLSFPDDTTYTFYIRESENQSKPGYLTDPNIWMVEVKVSYNDTTAAIAVEDVIAGQLTSEGKVASGALYIRKDDVKVTLVTPAAQEAEIMTAEEPAATTEKTKVTFTNVYKPEGCEVIIPVTKELTGRAMHSGEFMFRLMDGTRIVAETTNDASGNVVFKVPYTGVDMGNKAGSKAVAFNYKLVEVKGSAGNVTYDDSEKDVTVKIKESVVQEDGIEKLKLEGEILDGANAKFINVYDPNDAYVNITAQKYLDGRDMTDNMFAFELVNKDGKVVATGTNQADGTVVLVPEEPNDQNATLVLDKPDTYQYTLKEVNLGGNGMIYDTREYQVTVTVTDDLLGQLQAAVAYSEKDGTPAAVPVFYNRYEGQADGVSFHARKELKTESSRTLKAKEFTFELLDAEGNVLQTAQNDANGKIAFMNIDFEKEGTFQYTIREVAGEEKGMTYDKTEYKALVKVTHNLQEGRYEAEVSYEGPDGKVDDKIGPTFTNTFAPEPVRVALEATKKLSGRSLKDGEFKFTVYDSDGKKQATGTNDHNGEIVFSELTFTKAGVYKYTVKENKGLKLYMTYDRRAYEVTITVTETDGVLNATVSYPEHGITFRNYYNPSGRILPHTGDNIPLALLVGVAAVSAAGLVLMFLFGRKGKKRKE